MELRIIAAFLTGALFSQMGSLSQLLWRNSLASPSTLGVDGISVMIFLLVLIGVPLLGTGPVVLTILLVLFLLVKFSQKLLQSEQEGEEKLIIMGLSLNLMVGAIFTIIQFLMVAFDMEFPAELWFGQFRWMDQHKLGILLAAFVGLQILLRKRIKFYSLMNLGSEYLSLVNQRPFRFKLEIWIWLIVINTILVSFFGVFSFLSLIFPHMLKRFSLFERNLGQELFVGPLLCGAFLVFLDQMCFHFPIKGVEIPTGLVASFVGAGFLVVLLIQQISRVKLGKTA